MEKRELQGVDLATGDHFFKLSRCEQKGLQ